jgi:hypothetical protein
MEKEVETGMTYDQALILIGTQVHDLFIHLDHILDRIEAIEAILVEDEDRGTLQ